MAARINITNPSRRGLLSGGLAASVASLAAAIPTFALARSASDAGLVALGVEFDRELAALTSLREQTASIFGDMHFQIDALMAKQGGLVTWEQIRAIRDQTGAEAAAERSENDYERIDEITKSIREAEASTLAGVAVKLRAAAYDCGFIWQFDRPEIAMDWPEACFHQLMNEVEAMAARERDKVAA